MMLRATFELIGCEVELSGDYPGWAPDMDSSILKVLRSLYENLYNEKPHVAACHAGLECGILGTIIPDMEMISFGPNIRGAHSPDERAQISSVQKFWVFVLEILKADSKSIRFQFYSKKKAANGCFFCFIELYVILRLQAFQ